MTISSASTAAPLPAVAEAERSVMVLKKQQDASKDAGQALVALIQQSTVNESGRFSAYA